MKSNWKFDARCKRVIDGDTIVVTVDLGFEMRRDIKLRLKGVDTAETHFVSHDSDEYKNGVEQTEFVKSWIDEASEKGGGPWPLVVRSEKKGKYGRYVATVERSCDGDQLNERLLKTFENVDY